MDGASQELLPIGRFSFAVGLTVRALRHYDEIGLLRPSYIDDVTGYRYYALAQVVDAARIRRLRALGVPLEEIETLLRSDAAALRDRLRVHRDRVAAAAAANAQTLRALDGIIEGREELVSEPEIDLELTDEPVLRLAAAIRQVHDDGVPRVLHELIVAVREWLDERDVRPTGPPIGIFRSGDASGWHLLEAGFPVADDVATSGTGAAAVSVYGPSRAAAHDYRGHWRDFPAASRRFIGAVAQRGFHPSQPIRVVYPTLADLPRIPDPDWRARLVWPIRD